MMLTIKNNGYYRSKLEFEDGNASLGMYTVTYYYFLRLNPDNSFFMRSSEDADYNILEAWNNLTAEEKEWWEHGNWGVEGEKLRLGFNVKWNNTTVTVHYMIVSPVKLIDNNGNEMIFIEA
ncbi:MAG TPA: hypothetical protein VGO58_05970 [Chitinophagaceae bacterium]|jgi:hypothetical protein|nr:hypothetical protein [Chitinophagaceae bacterium]